MGCANGVTGLLWQHVAEAGTLSSAAAAAGFIQIWLINQALRRRGPKWDLPTGVHGEQTRHGKKTTKEVEKIQVQKAGPHLERGFAAVGFSNLQLG